MGIALCSVYAKTSTFFGRGGFRRRDAVIRVSMRYYDTRYSDYHRWNSAEVGPYSRWEVEVHRPHTEYRRLSPRDRQAYWEWRHDHR